jgi:hypothetical protein
LQVFVQLKSLELARRYLDELKGKHPLRPKELFDIEKADKPIIDYNSDNVIYCSF